MSFNLYGIDRLEIVELKDFLLDSRIFMNMYAFMLMDWIALTFCMGCSHTLIHPFSLELDILDDIPFSHTFYSKTTTSIY